jgi:hypothetical protein
MAHVVYEGHAIVYSSRMGKPDNDRVRFAPAAVIVWTDVSTGTPALHTLEFRGLYDSAVEAEAVAFNMAIRWVDEEIVARQHCSASG